MKIILGIVLGVALTVSFPEQTVEVSEFTRQQIHKGAEFLVEQTKDQTLVDKLVGQ